MKNRLLPMLVALLIGVVFVAAVPKSVFADDSVTTFIPQAVIDGQSKAGLDIYIGYCYTTATDGFNAPYGAFKNNGNPTSENIGNGDWFNTGFGTTHGSPSNIQKAADTVVREQILGWKNNETLWCDNLNKAGTTGTGTGLLDKANDMFGWGGMVQGACKLGLVRQNNSSCVSGDGDFKRGNWTAQATTTDTSPNFDSNAASYVRGYLSCVYNGGTPNFVKVSTASADTKATQKYTYSTVTISNDKAAVEQVYDTGSGNCGAQSHGGNNAQAYADWLNANPAMLKQSNASVATKNDPINGQGKAVCTGGSLGWILCPLTDMASNMINSLAGLIQSLLTYQPLLGSTQGSTIQKIWSIVVGIANLLLIVAFLIVIFSQATSIGLSAYGIKKMLPRIIAAAILINLSFFICALAVDLSNIIGASVQGIIQSASAQLPAAGGVKLAAGPWEASFVLVTGTLIAGTFVTGAIFYIFPFLLTAALTLLTAFVVLAVRQILITLLIIVAPLAFAAFVLPNTEDLFKKWQKLFVVLLVMYPLVMLIFYGSTFMSQLILMTKDTSQSGVNQFFTDIIAFIMLFVPLFILPTLMKLAGGILERFGGIVNDRSKGLVDRTRNWAGGRQKQQMQDVSNRKISWLQQNQGRKGIRGFAAGAGNIFDPSMQKIRRDEWSRQYDEAAKLSAARTASGAVSKSWRATDIQKARAEATLSELDMKEAKIKLDYQFNGDPTKAIEEALKTKDSALLKLSAGKFTDTAQLSTLQGIMASDDRIKDEHVASISDYLKENHFAKVKEQDLGMMYAMTDPNGLGKRDPDGKAIGGKAELAVLMGGGSDYDKKAVGGSNASVGTQEEYAIVRQAKVMPKNKAEAVLDDAVIQGTIKGKQRNALETIAGRPLTPII